MLKAITAVLEKGLDEFLEKPVVFPKSLLIMLKPLIYYFTMSIMAGSSEYTFYTIANYFNIFRVIIYTEL